MYVYTGECSTNLIRKYLTRSKCGDYRAIARDNLTRFQFILKYNNFTTLISACKNMVKTHTKRLNAGIPHGAA